MDLRQSYGEDCGRRSTGNTVRSNPSEIIGFDLKLKKKNNNNKQTNNQNTKLWKQT